MDVRGLDGMAQLRALMQPGFVAGIAESLDFTLIEIGDDRDASATSTLLVFER